MKLDEAIVESVLRTQDLDPKKVTEIMRDLKERQALDTPPPAPRVKYETVVLLSDPEKKYRDVSIVGWVVQVPEDTPLTEAPNRLVAAANDFNTTPKGRRVPVSTLGETCESVTRRHFKENGIKVMTKMPVTFLPVDNALPEYKDPES